MMGKSTDRYVDYELGVRVRIKNTDREGEAFESALGFISVFLDDMDGKLSVFKMNEVEFLNEGKKLPTEEGE